MTHARHSIEQAQLHADIARGRDIVLLSGPAGVGKTWLADALLARLVTDGAVGGRGKYGDEATGAAHAPIVAALSGALRAALARQFDPQRGLASLTHALGVQLEVLIAIGLRAPGLTGPSALQPLLDHRQWRGRIRAATAALLAWLDGFGARVVLLIDDWDRAPVEAAGLLADLVRPAAGRAPLLILTGRSAGAEALLPTERVGHRRLAERDRAAAIALLADLLDDAVAAGAIAARLGDGFPTLPFDLVQLAEVAREAGWLVPHGKGRRFASERTEPLAFAPAERIAALSHAVRRAAHGLTLWGDGSRDGLAAALGDAAALAALVAAGIAVADDERLAFRHDRLREAARDDCGDPRKLAAAMAERLPAHGPDEAVALELRLAGGLVDAPPAVWRDRFASGARAARGRGDPAAAGRFAEAALTLDAHVPAPDPDARRLILREAMLAAAGRDDPATVARADALIASARNQAEAFADREQAIVALRFAGLSDAALRIARAGFAAVGVRVPQRVGRRHLIPTLLRWRWLQYRAHAGPQLAAPLLMPFTGMASAAATTAYQHDPLLTAWIGARTAPLVGRTARTNAYWRGVDAFLFGAAGQPARSAAAGDAALAALPEQVGYRGQSLYQATFFGTCWRDRLADVRPRFREVVALALAEGDPVMAAYGLRTWTMSGWRSGHDLRVVLAEARTALPSLVALGEQSLIDEIASLVATLEGLTGERPWSPALWRTDLPARSHVFDLELSNLAGDWAGTLRLSRSFAPLARDYAIQSESILMAFHAMFARLKLGRDVRRADLRRLRRAAALNPADHAARLLLVEAERLHLHGGDARAGYAAAVAAAEENDSPLLTGLAAEAAADAVRADDASLAASYDARAARSWRAWRLHPQVRGRDTTLVAEAEARAVAAERADHAKSRLIAHVGHELRTPLQALQAQLDLAVAEERPLAAETVRAMLAGLGAVVDDLDLFGDRDLHGDRPDPAVGLAELLRSEVAMWEGVTPVQLVLAAAPAPLALPAARVRQIVRNLLSNAAKYGGGGPVTVTLIAGDATPVAVTLTVADSGPGLPPDALERIFEPLERARPDDATSGSGLGLALARRIAERMGGTLTAANRAEGGACFTLMFRAERAAAPVPVAAPTALDLLLVEDNALIRTAIAALLSRAGHRVRIAADAAGALAELRTEAALDAVLLDVGLPDASGLTVLDHVRVSLGPLPVVLLTAAVGPELAARVAADPALRLLRKPASEAALVAVLAELCGSAAAIPPGAPPEYERLRRRARREVRVRGGRLVRAPRPDPDAAHQLAGLAAQFGWNDVAVAAEQLGDASGADRLRGALAAMA